MPSAKSNRHPSPDRRGTAEHQLSVTVRWELTDEEASDEALIAGLPTDLRAIAEQIAQAWPGHALDASLNTRGALVRPARLAFDLPQGGRIQVEVRPEGSAAQPAVDAPLASGDGLAWEASPLAEALQRWLRAEPDRAGLAQGAAYAGAYRVALQVLSEIDPQPAHQALRLVRAFAGPYRALVAKDRSGEWRSLPATPVVDPYYACAAFDGLDGIQRIPLPQLLPDAAGSRRAFALARETRAVLGLLECLAPDKLARVRQAGREYLARRREWLSRSRFDK